MTYYAWTDSDAYQWVDNNTAQWIGITNIDLLRQIWTDSSLYIYVATSKFLNVIDATEEAIIAQAEVTNGFTTVWANDDVVFLGTTISGIKMLYKSDIAGDILSPQVLNSYIHDLNFFYGTSSSGVRYLHGNGNFLLSITDTEVDVLQMGSNPYRSSSTTVSGNAYKGFMTSTGKFYYTLNGPQWSIERVDVPVMDWDSTHVSYVANGVVLASGIQINDIFVTEKTSVNGLDNTLFIATSSGVYVIDEGSDIYSVYYTTGG